MDGTHLELKTLLWGRSSLVKPCCPSSVHSWASTQGQRGRNPSRTRAELTPELELLAKDHPGGLILPSPDIWAAASFFLTCCLLGDPCWRDQARSLVDGEILSSCVSTQPCIATLSPADWLQLSSFPAALLPLQMCPLVTTLSLPGPPASAASAPLEASVQPEPHLASKPRSQHPSPEPVPMKMI